MTAAKPFNIPKKLVAAAFRAVKSNAGGAGIDKETIGQFESKHKDNLYKIWNRMSSGTYRRSSSAKRDSAAKEVRRL